MATTKKKKATTKAATAGIGIDDMGEVFRTAKNRFNRMNLGSYVKTDNVPLVIGAFAVGAAAGVLGAMFLPQLKDTTLFSGISGKLVQAKDAVMEKVQQVRNDTTATADQVS